jgi:hypothetical protein
LTSVSAAEIKTREAEACPTFGLHLICKKSDLGS